MRNQEKGKNWFQKLLHSKLILGGMVILLIFISITLGKAVYRRYQIQKEIEAIKKEVEKAEGKNKELTQLLEYLSTAAFREKMARQKLNLKREGENVVIVPARKPSEETILGEDNTTNRQNNSSPSKMQDKFENPKKWWYYFFSNF